MPLIKIAKSQEAYGMIRSVFQTDVGDHHRIGARRRDFLSRPPRIYGLPDRLEDPRSRSVASSETVLQDFDHSVYGRLACEEIDSPAHAVKLYVIGG
jgi:hypothetical protein